MRYLLDTDICIYLLKSQPPQVVARFSTLDSTDVAVSIITLAELMAGAYKSQQQEQNLKRLERLAQLVSIVPYTEALVATYGQTRALLEGQGTPIGPLDTLIACHALALNLTLVSNNTREYARIPKLQLENWTEEA